MLSDRKPRKIVIVDAMDFRRRPGELFAIDIDSYPKIKLDDFSMHQLPTSNLLRELRDFCGVEVTVMACQVSDVPESVKPGLSKSVKAAVERAAQMLAQEHFQ
jgi:coenzyme F420 hydrogenase subunit delta